MNDTLKAVRKSLTLTEWGVVISIISSVFLGVFTIGFMYGQVQNNTVRLNVIEPKVDGVVARIERIDANVTFLTDLAREERGRHKR